MSSGYIWTHEGACGDAVSILCNPPVAWGCVVCYVLDSEPVAALYIDPVSLGIFLLQDVLRSFSAW